MRVEQFRTDLVNLCVITRCYARPAICFSSNARSQRSIMGEKNRGHIQRAIKLCGNQSDVLRLVLFQRVDLDQDEGLRRRQHALSKNQDAIHASTSNSCKYALRAAAT